MSCHIRVIEVIVFGNENAVFKNGKGIDAIVFCAIAFFKFRCMTSCSLKNAVIDFGKCASIINFMLRALEYP